jgi:hypothetical protein
VKYLKRDELEDVLSSAPSFGRDLWCADRDAMTSALACAVVIWRGASPKASVEPMHAERTIIR